MLIWPKKEIGRLGKLHQFLFVLFIVGCDDTGYLFVGNGKSLRGEGVGAYRPEVPQNAGDLALIVFLSAIIVSPHLYQSGWRVTYRGAAR